MPTLTVTADQIKAQAATLGFDICQITSPDPVSSYPFFEKWLAQNCHGDMAWLAREPERRRDPRALLPDCRSIIITGTNYFQKQAPLRGQIATYALGKDYHEILANRLRHLCAWLQAQVGGQHRPFVDTSALLEKPLAMRAGLGWQGKNTMLIHPRLGNWLSLGGILSSAQVDFDAPQKDHCGTCQRCLQACPTQAITAPYQLDARRCIAYLTIEHQGPIPLEFRHAVGDRLFGCDDCLTVCPWNRWAVETKEAHFQALPRPDLRNMLDWDDATFRQHYRDTPIFRLKHSRWLRNICVVLGNIGTLEDLPSLEKVSLKPDALVQEHALWAIQQIQNRNP
jgi:epoxyqueuosine reductase